MPWRACSKHMHGEHRALQRNGPAHVGVGSCMDDARGARGI